MRKQNDTPPDVLVARKAAEQHGQITTRQLRACGLSDQTILHRVRTGRLHRMYRGVYAVGHPPITIEGRLMAAILACGERAYVSHYSGSAHLGFMTWEDRPLEITVVGTSARRIEGIRVHRARSLHWRDTYRHNGIPVTAPARTLLDLAAILPEPALRSAARRAQALHRVNVRQLLETINRSNGHPGTGALRAIVADGPAPTRSDLEDIVLDLLDGAGIERPEINAPLRFGAVTIIPDFLWRKQRVAIEADGVRWHEHKLTRERDADKQAILEAAGWHVLRIDADQTLRRPDQTLARIRAALAPS